MALTIEEEAEVKAVAAERIKACAVAALAVTRASEMAAAQVVYDGALQAARAKFDVGVVALEK